jgi:glycosyltransferase involved in cell wall biosynthesis
MERRIADIAIAMCTFNGSQYIRAQIESFARQTVLPKEIVISDDASTDGSLDAARLIISELILKFQDFSRVHINFRANPVGLGVTKNFEKALAATSQPLIALCDQDDIWFDDKIEVLEAAMRLSSKLGLVFSDANLVDDTGTEFGDGLFDALGLSAAELEGIATTNAYRVLLRRNIVTGATVVIRRELFDVAAPFPSAWLHDEWLAIVAAMQGFSLQHVHPLIAYRQHASNQVGVKKSTVSRKLHALRQERGVRNERLFNRALQLHSRSVTWTLLPQQRKIIRAKLDHEIARKNYSGIRVARLLPILREAVSFRYFSVGRGFRDILRDLVQPN